VLDERGFDFRRRQVGDNRFKLRIQEGVRSLYEIGG